LKVRYIVLIVTAALVGAAALFLTVPGLLPRPDGGPRDGFSAAELAMIKPGDVILRKGVGIASDMIVISLGGGVKVSHCALVREQEGQLWVVHTLNGTLTGVDGVQSQVIENFNRYSDVDTLVVLRPKVTATQKADYLAQVEVLLSKNVPFDNAYDLDNRDKMYCSELLLDVFQKSGFYHTTTRYPMFLRWLSFTMFLDKQYFDVVINHNPSVREWLTTNQ